MSRLNKNDKIRSRLQKGSATLFVAFVILPLLGAIFSLTVDVSHYYTLRTRAQKVADEAVMYAYRFLPATGDARGALGLYVGANAPELDLSPENAANYNISVEPDFITFTYSGTLNLTLPKLLLLDITIPFSVEASVRSTPLDIHIAMDNSLYLAPNIHGDQLWKDAENNIWPAAHYFANELKFPKPGSPTGEYDYQLVTQQCFNPVFSTLKTATIRLYEYLGTFKLNRVGLGFFPGNNIALDVARGVLTTGPRAGAQGEADFQETYGSQFHRATYCAAAAEKELQYDGYKFPGKVGLINSTFECQGASNSIIDPITQQFDKDYQPCLRADQVIWSRSVASRSNQDMPETFSMVESEVFGSTPREVVEGKSGLDASVARIGIVIAGDLPHGGDWVFNPAINDHEWVSYRFPDQRLLNELDASLEATIERVREGKFKYTLYYVLFKRPDIDQGIWNQELVALQTHLDQFNNRNFGDPSDSRTGSFSVKVFAAEDPNKLSEELISLILLQKKTVMLAR